MIPEIQSQLWYLEIGVGIIVILGIAYGPLFIAGLVILYVIHQTLADFLRERRREKNNDS